MRASDADRDRAAAALREHHAAGRITDDEFEERLATVLAARALSDLAAPFADLTPPPPPPPPPRAPARVPSERVEVGGFGLRSFRQRHELACTRAVAWQRMMAHIVPSMTAYGYTIVDRAEPDYLVFELQERPAWPWFFLGFLAVFYKPAPSRVVVSLTEAGPARTELTVTGAARRPVRRAFAGISADA